MTNTNAREREELAARARQNQLANLANETRPAANGPAVAMPHPSTGMAATNNPTLSPFFKPGGKDSDALGLVAAAEQVFTPDGLTADAASQTIELAGRTYSAFSRYLPPSSLTGQYQPGEPVMILGRDPQRQKAIFSSSSIVLIGRRQDIAANSGFLIPANTLHTTEVQDEIYACIPWSTDAALQARSSIASNQTTNAGATAGISNQIVGVAGYRTYITSWTLTWDGSAAGALNTSVLSSGLGGVSYARISYVTGVGGSLTVNYGGTGLPAANVGANASLFVSAHASNPATTLTINYVQIPEGGGLPGAYVNVWVERN